MERTLSDLLEDLPEAELHEMVAGARRKMQRLQFEIEMVQDVLARKVTRGERQRSERPKRTRTPQPKTQTGQFAGSLSRHDLFATFADQRRNLRAGDILGIARSKGLDVTKQQVATAIPRLVKDGKLRHVKYGVYAVVSNQNGPAPDAAGAEAGSPLSREPSLRS